MITWGWWGSSRHTALPCVCYRYHQMPHSLPQLCPASPSGCFPGLHTELPTAVFHFAVLHYSHILHQALSFLSKRSPPPAVEVLASHSDTKVTLLTAHAWGSCSLAELACLGEENLVLWATEQNSLADMFWGYFLQFLFFQQWSLVARDILIFHVCPRWLAPSLTTSALWEF